MRVISLLLAILTCFAATCCAAAGLVWKQDRIQLVVDNTTEVVHASFAYSNAGARPVRVLVERPSCDCMVVGSPSFSVKPGVSGALGVTLRIMGQVGQLRKELWVATDAPDAAPVRLELDVEVQERIAVRPRLLFWTVGDAPTPKTVSVVVKPAGTASLVSASAGSTAFGVAARPGARPGEWSVSIHPLDTKARMNSVVTLDFADSDGTPRRVQVYLVVR